jgi:L-asparaginase II
LIEAVPGLIAKDGAEGVFVAALPDGAAVAVKVADGSARPRTQLAAAGLVRCGAPAEALAEFLDGSDGEPADGVRLAPQLFRKRSPHSW